MYMFITCHYCHYHSIQRTEGIGTELDTWNIYSRPPKFTPCLPHGDATDGDVLGCNCQVTPSDEVP